jgi:hypothetical protein
MQDLANGLHSCTVFSKIDLVKGYHKVLIAEADIPKPVIIIPFGLIEYLFRRELCREVCQDTQTSID